MREIDGPPMREIDGRGFWDRVAFAAWRSAGRLVEPAAALLLRERERRGKEEGERLAERRGIPGRKRPAGPLVWVHAASVGETNAVLALIAAIQEQGLGVLLTTGTVTSAKIARARLKGNAIHQYVPLDVPRYCARFVQHWRPGLAIFVESELWPVAMDELSRHGVPLVVVNGRMSPRSFRRWRQSGPLGRSIMRRISLCLAQTGDDAARFKALGMDKVMVSGNLKFDAPKPSAPAAELAAFRETIEGRPVFLGASLHPGEDEQVLAAAEKLRAVRPDLLTILAPRHPERAPALADLCRNAGLTPALRSAGDMPDMTKPVFIADTIGEMGLWYRLADVTFLGGTLIPHGGQNPIEPAKLAVPILHGPHTANFAEIFAALRTADAVGEVSGADDLAAQAEALFANPEHRRQRVDAATHCIESLTGALERSLDALRPYLPVKPAVARVGEAG
ncbi:3-deoxy-D-manno-octulosonic acid transferase [Afifella sp. H1R]|uniref:3-deoxy-D-manno-octulosonic acid transferase n=1 Tax=Afifella sp. H1R TaxID=2908841 RepID=UPI001F4660FA|nr:3-deoxy-D-manno-octulosonic acid transferase [Afifella sp. H1R]MCF1504527.1 3-deoxy-D-manno-octulosonic acid transferase [Afifella sp. H1R]